MSPVPILVMVLALLWLGAAPAAAQIKVAIAGFRVSGEGVKTKELEYLSDELPRQMKRRMEELGKVQVEFVDRSTFEIFNDVETLGSKEFFVTGEVASFKSQGNQNKLRLKAQVIRLTRKGAKIDRAPIKEIEVLRDDDPWIVDWAKRFAGIVHEAITGDRQAKTVFVHCFLLDQRLSGQFGEYRWRVPERLAQGIPGEAAIVGAGLKTFEPHERRTACDTPPSIDRLVVKNDFILGGWISPSADGQLEVPINLRSTVLPEESREVGEAVRERAEFDSLVKAVFRHIRLNLPKAMSP